MFLLPTIPGHLQVYCNFADELCVGRNYYIAVTWTCVRFWRWSGSIYNN